MIYKISILKWIPWGSYSLSLSRSFLSRFPESPDPFRIRKVTRFTSATPRPMIIKVAFLAYRLYMIGSLAPVPSQLGNRWTSRRWRIGSNWTEQMWTALNTKWNEPVILPQFSPRGDKWRIHFDFHSTNHHLSFTISECSNPPETFGAFGSIQKS